MNNWSFGNKGFAEWMTLHRVIGYLQAGQGTCIRADALVKFINETVDELTESLDERFPEREEGEHEVDGAGNNRRS